MRRGGDVTSTAESDDAFGDAVDEDASCTAAAAAGALPESGVGKDMRFELKSVAGSAKTEDEEPPGNEVVERVSARRRPSGDVTEDKDGGAVTSEFGDNDTTTADDGEFVAETPVDVGVDGASVVTINASTPG